MSLWFDILLIGIFILFNGFFAAAEIAVVTIRRSRLNQLVEEGKENAKILKKLRENPEHFLATIQIGVTLAGAIASAIGGAIAVEVIKPILSELPIPFISHASEAIAIGFVVILITYFSLIFGELIPKTIALSRPEGIGLFFAPFIERFSSIAGIFIKALTNSTNFILKPFGKTTSYEKSHISEEEVKILLEEGRQQGVFESGEKELIHSVFEFADTSVKEVMVPNTQMVTINVNMSSDEIKQIISEEKFSRYPVVGKDINDIRGILYAKDFYNVYTPGVPIILHRILKSPYFIPETMKISNLLREMQKKRMHMAIVIDEYGAVSGIVTLEDLIEEIVGEIRDEYDTESPVIRISDGSFIIDASINVNDLNDDYGIEIPTSDEYDTLGGFIVTHLQRIPKTGDVINLPDKTIKVLEMVGQRISKVRLELIKQESSDGTQP
ncbi:MAG: hemolysin family protein [Thermodesulfovibrionales bacterium]|nr:hemolysin family protein [Thermodesulfovibrionales bacterium]